MTCAHIWEKVFSSFHRFFHFAGLRSFPNNNSEQHWLFATNNRKTIHELSIDYIELRKRRQWSLLKIIIGSSLSCIRVGQIVRMEFVVFWLLTYPPSRLPRRSDHDHELFSLHNSQFEADNSANVSHLRNHTIFGSRSGWEVKRATRVSRVYDQGEFNGRSIGTWLH